MLKMLLNGGSCIKGATTIYRGNDDQKMLNNLLNWGDDADNELVNDPCGDEQTLL